MNSRDVLVAAFIFAVSTSIWAQLPPGVTITPGGGLIVGPGAPPNVVINMPGFNPNQVIVTNPGQGVTINGVAVSVGVSGTVQTVRPDATPGEIRSGFPSRSSGFGAAPQLNMRIQGDGIALPKGVGESGKSQADREKEQTRDKDKESAQEKARGEDAGGSKGQGIAITSPRLEKGQGADGGEGKTRDSSQNERKDGSPPAALRPGGGDSLPPKTADRKPVISAPREEKEQDPVARRIDQGLERNPGATLPTDLNVKGPGVAVPRCFGESREGEKC